MIIGHNIDTKINMVRVAYREYLQLVLLLYIQERMT